MSRAQHVAQVLLDTSLPQLDHLFDYSVPDALRAELKIGQRVKVPLRAGSRSAFGYVVELRSHSEFDGELSTISEVVSRVPALSPHLYRLARAIADRAAGSANDIIRLVIPTRQVRVEKQFLSHMEASGLTFTSDALHRTELPVAAMQTSQASDKPSPRSPSATRIAVTCPPGPVRLTTGEWVPAWAQEIAARISPYLNEHQSVILAVPDQYDLHVAVDALTAQLPDAVLTRVDSQQSNAERYRSFLDSLTASPRVVIGNRSAVYASAFNLGAIFLWDDADALFEEPLSPYVHARDAALIRSVHENCDLVFTSNLHSLETERLRQIGFLSTTPQVSRPATIVTGLLVNTPDTQHDRLPDPARKVIREGIQHGPVLVQVGASGFGTAIICATCHEQQRCPSCGGPLQRGADEDGTQTTSPNATLSCRWCYATNVGEGCAHCDSTELSEWGAGARSTASQMTRLFPEVPVRVSEAKNRMTFIDSRPCIVIATRGAEPLAAGGYRAVVFLDVDHALSVETLSADLNAYRGWTNASALAAPDATLVLVGAAHPAVEAFALNRDASFLERTLRERQALRFPPAVRTATLFGVSEAVHTALSEVSRLDSVDVLDVINVRDGKVRASIRFGYDIGSEVAAELRRAVLRSASRTRRAPEPTRSAFDTRLRVRFDDTSIFDDRSLGQRGAIRGE